MPVIPPRYRNNRQRYGAIARMLHWLIALLILTLVPLGLIAAYWTGQGPDAMQTRITLFSAHKTLGIVALFTGLLRVCWALYQPVPAPIPPSGKARQFWAEATHWLLYLSLIVVPLSGWVHHAATDGFAPVWLPIGDTLPFVSTSEPIAHAASAIHFVATKALILTVIIHIGAALRHHFVYKNATLSRMISGTTPLPALPERHQTHMAPVAALVIWAAVIGISLGITTGPAPQSTQTSELAAMPSDWTVTQGSLAITVQQMGTELRGGFDDWTAEIGYCPTPVDGIHGSVIVEIAVNSLHLGSVSLQALGPGFFNAAAYPTARFEGDIIPNAEIEAGYLAQGTLSLAGAEAPLSLPFTLRLEGNRAEVQASTIVDRRTFGIAQAYGDESIVGFSVRVDIVLAAQNASPC